MKRPISDERAVLDGHTLRLTFRSTAPCFACDLKDVAGTPAKTAPLLPVGGGYACSFDISTMPDGIYALAIRSGSESIPFGNVIAGQLKKATRATSKKPEPSSKVATSRLPPGGGSAFAALYVAPADAGLRLRLSASDDIDAFLTAPADTTPTRFTVISAVYNVEKYLDPFFASLTSQSLDFTSHIEVIAVDDGSTDRSAKIIKAWQRKFPDNIRYFHKANGGPASARTLGLAHASHAWLTFIDPDDYVDRDYFAEVAGAIRRHGEDNVSLVSCNLIFHFEADGTDRDTHPLRFRFAQGEKAVSTGDPGRYIQMSTATAFFRRSVVADAGLEFDRRVRPGFEDANFVGRYLLAAPAGLAVFLPQVKYYYRKRGDSSSIVDGFEANPEWYGDHLRYGYLGLLNAGGGGGRIPRFVQNAILYSLSWKFHHIVDRPEVLTFLGDERQRQFQDLLSEVFALIDVDAVMDYSVTDLPFAWRVGILNLFKDTDPPFQLAEVDALDEAASLARVTHWTRSPEPSAVFRSGGRAVEPRYTKVRRRDFAGRAFVWEHIDWVPVDEGGRLSVLIGDKEATISIRHRRFKEGIAPDDLRRALAERVPDAAMPDEVRMLRRAARSPKATADFRDAWLFIDRDSEADDSAEHLYRHVREHLPDVNAFFVLARDTPHWKRLATDGFCLLAFNEPEHALALLNAAHLISSHADHYVTGYLDRRYFGDLLRFRFTYLRHGISKDDTSAWLNGQDIDCLVATTPAEFESIARDGSPYKFTRKEVVLTGLPRHDALLRDNTTERRYIVVMPTWRSSLTGPALGAGNARSDNPAFFESEFARRWKSFLHAPRLAGYARQGYKVVFVPHPNMEHYVDRLALPEHIRLRRFSDGASISEIFQKCAVFVTDYSSKAFDLALLEKPVVYYQFDRDVFFGGGHMGRAGYFDYARDGFGPVVAEEDQAFAAVGAILSVGGMEARYLERARATFPFRDGRNCARVLDAILALDTPLRVNQPLSA